MTNQAKALKKLYKVNSNPGLKQELFTVTDFALLATKVPARSLRQVMSTMVVQECHLWLNLPEMQDTDKVHFLDTLMEDRRGSFESPLSCFT